jgi:hypothetical protein
LVDFDYISGLKVHASMYRLNDYNETALGAGCQIASFTVQIQAIDAMERGKAKGTCRRSIRRMDFDS